MCHGTFPFSLESRFKLTEIQLGIAYAFGARFDVALSELTQGKLSKPTDAGAAQSIIHKYDHGEL